MTKKAITALAFSLCTAGVLMTSCSETEKAEATSPAPNVKVFNIRKVSVTDSAVWMGYLRGVQDTDLYPRVSGFIISYKEGQHVKEGDVIFQIAPEPFQAELERAQANLQAAKAALTQAIAERDKWQSDCDRYTALKEKEGKEHKTITAVSEKTYTEARLNLQAAEAKVKACEADIKQKEAACETAQINLDYTSVRAPYSGFVGTANVSTGALVGPTTKLGNIVSDGPLRVDFSINSDALLQGFERFGQVESATINENLQAESPKFELILEDGSVYTHDNAPVKGDLLSINSRIDKTGLVDIVGTIENPAHKLRSGMKVNVRIPLAASKRDALLVPPSAIYTVLRNNFIIVVDAQNVPHAIPVVEEGTYEIEVTEPETGYTSKQQFVAIGSYTGTPLDETIKPYLPKGETDVTKACVVADPDNGVQAMNISSANSRLPERKKEQEEAYKKQKDSTLSSFLIALGMEDEIPSPDTIVPATVKPEILTFKPADPRVAQQQAQPQIDPNAKATQPPVPVKVTSLRQQDISVYSDWFGSLRGKEETEIRPHINGFLLQQHFRNGTIVNEGDILYTIDPRPYQAQLDQANANLASAEAGKTQAEVELAKAQDTLSRKTKANIETPNTYSEKDITEAKSAVQAQEAALRFAEANVAQMKAAVKTAEINLSYTTIKAPFRGRVGISKPSIGALVSSTDPEAMVTLSSVDTLRVDFQVSGRDTLLITNQVGINNPNGGMPFKIILEDGSEYPVEGKIVSPDNIVKKSTGTFGIVGEVENVTHGLRSGMPVTVRIVARDFKNAYIVPARAPMNAEGHDIVLLVGPDGAPTAVPIKRGPIVTIPVAGPDGKEVEQPMQVIELNPQLLVHMGFVDEKGALLPLDKIKVIVEGTIPAAMAMQANMKANGRANKVAPREFIYTMPKTVEPSVTADKTPTSNLKKF